MSYKDLGYDSLLSKNILDTGITLGNAGTMLGDTVVGFDNIDFTKFEENQNLQSKNFLTGSAGWQIRGDGGCEFSDVTVRGTIEAATINIPDSTSPLFSVDIDGNVIANSLRRNDFHWFTLFESIDGYNDDFTGGGSSKALSAGFVTLTSGSTQYDYASLYKNPSVTNDIFTWDKQRSFKTVLDFGSNVNFRCAIGMGDNNEEGNGTTLVNRRVCFRVDAGTLYGYVANGTTATTVNLGAISAGVYTFEAVFIPETSVKFYVDGVLEGTATTNIPTGLSDANLLFSAYIESRSNAAKNMTFSYYDFWQAN